MTQHRASRRPLRARLTGDWSRRLGFRRAARIIATTPRLMLYLALDLGVGFGLLAVALALFGKLDSLGTWAFIPATLSGGLVADRLRREGTRRGL